MSARTFGFEDEAYSGWGQLAGYFDGDGSITVRRTSRGRPFTLHPALEFSDQPKRQIMMVREFLFSRGVKVGKLSLGSGSWRVEIGTIHGATLALQEMIPFLYKKRIEARATLDYLSDKITANEPQQILKAAVRRRDRERLAPYAHMPWTRSEGAKKALEYSQSLAGSKPSIGLEVENAIIRQHQSGESQNAIARSRGLKRGVVKRAISRQKIKPHRLK